MYFVYSGEEAKDEPYAWKAREFLRKKLVGEEVWFTAEKPQNATREYGVVLLGKGNFTLLILCYNIRIWTKKKLDFLLKWKVWYFFYVPRGTFRKFLIIY